MKIIKYNVHELNLLLKTHKTLRKIAPRVINIHDGKVGTTPQSLSRWLKNNGYYLDTQSMIKKR